jgi:DNA-binding MarR family transcriptional regulator
MYNLNELMSDNPSTGTEATALRAFNLFIQTARTVEKEADKLMRDAVGISTGQFMILVALDIGGGSVTSSALASATGTKPHNVTMLVERMKRDGLVSTQRKGGDRRFVHVDLTDRGRALTLRAIPIARKMVGATMASISISDLERLERMMNVLKRNVSTAGASSSSRIGRPIALVPKSAS